MERGDDYCGAFLECWLQRRFHDDDCVSSFLLLASVDDFFGGQ